MSSHEIHFPSDGGGVGGVGAGVGWDLQALQSAAGGAALLSGTVTLIVWRFPSSVETSRIASIMSISQSLSFRNENQDSSPERTALNLRSPAPWGPDTGKVQETERLAWFTAMEALYQGPRAMGLPIASAICWFWVAFSIAWLEQERKTASSLTALAVTAPVRPSSESATPRRAHAPAPSLTGVDDGGGGGGVVGGVVGLGWAERRRRRRGADVEAA